MMNLKLVAVAVSFLALQCSVSGFYVTYFCVSVFLQALTPDELLKNLALIESNLLVRRDTVQNNLESYLSVLADHVNASESTLSSELETASQPFWDSIDLLTIKAAENGTVQYFIVCAIICFIFAGKNISVCTNDIFNQFIQLQSAALEKAKNKIVTVNQTGENMVYNVIVDIQEKIDIDFSKLKEKFTTDCTDTCATELNSELIQFYQSALSDINSAVAEVIQYIFITAPNELASNVLDTDQLQSDYQVLIDYVAACVGA